jgi:hypothetical protein
MHQVDMELESTLSVCCLTESRPPYDYKRGSRVRSEFGNLDVEH